MSSNAVLDNIYGRRSVRSYSDEPVKEEDIRELIKAGFHAANGRDTQALRFSVVTNKAKLKEYSDKGKKLFLGFMKATGMVNPDLEANLSNEAYDLFYGAPAVIFIYAAPSSLTPVEDASLAAGNIMLAARSLGMGTCWMRVAMGLAGDAGFLKDNNVPGDHKMILALILGYPKDKAQGNSVRSEPQILSWLR